MARRHSAGEPSVTILSHEKIMSRKYIDCRGFPGDIKCTLAMSADIEAELLKAAVRHAVDVHGYKDTRMLRRDIKSAFKNGTPRVKAPRPAA